MIRPFLAAFLLACSLLLFPGCGNSQNRVAVYCALDREFAEDILKDFTQKTGLEVVPRWDTESNKSVGLYEDLIREARTPRCDVHWNNEILATIRLQKRGLLEPYPSPSAAPYPAPFKAADHTWTAFAARARVFLVNTKLVPDPKDWPRRLADMTAPGWRGQFAMARPMFGTTASQAACLFAALGPEATSQFFRKVKENDVKILPGNKQVAVTVGLGKLAFGLTDTDDALAEIDEGNPVAVVFPDAAASPENPLGALFLPNTVAIIKGCPNPEGARKLVDYLLSPEVEAKLARSKGGQIPLNPEVRAEVPTAIRPPAELKTMTIDFTKAADLWENTQKFLAKEFAP